MHGLCANDVLSFSAPEQDETARVLALLLILLVVLVILIRSM